VDSRVGGHVADAKFGGQRSPSSAANPHHHCAPGFRYPQRGYARAVTI